MGLLIVIIAALVVYKAAKSGDLPHYSNFKNSINGAMDDAFND